MDSGSEKKGNEVHSTDNTVGCHTNQETTAHSVTTNKYPKQEVGGGDGPDEIDLCQDFTANFDKSSSDSQLCKRAYSGKQYNREGKRRHSRGKSEEAFNCFERAAQNGSSDALFNLGLCYEEGIGVQKDTSKAAVQYAKATVKDHKHAAFNLGMMTMNGYCEMNPNQEEGIGCLKKAASLGLAKASTELGVIAVRREPAQWAEAAQLFEKAANEKEPDAIGMLFSAHVYQYGLGRETDESKASSIYCKAARLFQDKCKKETNCDDGMLYALGLCYEHGWGLPKSTIQARDCYQRSTVKDAKTRAEKLAESSSESIESESSSESQNEDWCELMMNLVNFRPTIGPGSLTRMQDTVTMRETLESKDDGSWGSYDGCCESSGESISMENSSSETPDRGKTGGKDVTKITVDGFGHSVVTLDET